MSFLMSSAMAAEPAATTAAAEHGQAAGGISTMIFLGVFFVIFYFLFIRPQNKRAKEQKNMISTLAKGDEVVTAGGLTGKVTHVDENFVNLEIAKGVEVMVQKFAISSTLPKGSLKHA